MSSARILKGVSVYGLICTARNGSLGEILGLLAAGTAIDYRSPDMYSGGWTPLHYAARHGHAEAAGITHTHTHTHSHIHTHTQVFVRIIERCNFMSNRNPNESLAQ